MHCLLINVSHPAQEQIIDSTAARFMLYYLGMVMDPDRGHISSAPVFSAEDHITQPGTWSFCFYHEITVFLRLSYPGFQVFPPLRKIPRWQIQNSMLRRIGTVIVSIFSGVVCLRDLHHLKPHGKIFFHATPSICGTPAGRIWKDSTHPLFLQVTRRPFLCRQGQKFHGDTGIHMFRGSLFRYGFPLPFRTLQTRLSPVGKKQGWE